MTTPRYLQLRRLLRLRIETGVYQPGAALPSVNELAAEQDINRHTVLKAIEPLVDEGMLKPLVGRGYYVVGKAVARELETLDGFTHTMTERGAKPAVKVLAQGYRKAGPKYAGVFGLDASDDLYYVKRLCLSNGEPFSLEKILFPASILPEAAELELSAFSLYELFSFYGVHLTRAWQTLKITTLEPADARTLDIEPSTPVILFECTSYDADSVVEFTRTYTRSDRANFITHFAR